MAYPLIILGAGASYDYLEKDGLPFDFLSRFKQYRAPLVNSLFDETRFSDITGRHPDVISLASEALNTMSRADADFEGFLTKLKNELAVSNKQIYSQLVSLIFYLSDLFHVISNEYYFRTNHYKDLLQKIDHYCNSEACFVNFNYDLLLERALEEHPRASFSWKSIDSYISNQVQVIKIHGACNWRYNPRVISSKNEFASAESYFINNAEITINKGGEAEIFPFCKELSENSYSPEFNEGLNNWTISLPALALPLKEKGNYICPDSHIKSLEQALSSVDRVIIIGWSAGDSFLIELLNKALSDRKLPIAVVGGKSTKDKVLPRLGESLAKKVEFIGQDGFSDFMRSGKCEEFLSKQL